MRAFIGALASPIMSWYPGKYFSPSSWLGNFVALQKRLLPDPRIRRYFIMLLGQQLESHILAKTILRQYLTTKALPIIFKRYISRASPVT